MKNTKLVVAKANEEKLLASVSDEAILKAYKAIKEKQPKKERTKKSINRSGINRAMLNRLVNFDPVYKDVRANILLLPNRVTKQHIESNKQLILSKLNGLALDSYKQKPKFLERLPEILTNRNLFICGMTVRQLSKYEKDVKFSSTELLDIVAKLVTMSEANYGKVIALYEQRKEKASEEKRRAEIKARKGSKPIK